MKNKTITVVFKSIALFLSWLTQSPLLLILDGRWKLLSKCLQVVLFLVSPMMNWFGSCISFIIYE